MAGICIAQPAIGKYSETFLHTQAELLPCHIRLLHWEGCMLPCADGQPILSRSLPSRFVRKVSRICRRQPWDSQFGLSFETALLRHRPGVVLAQYGPSGVKVLDACRRTHTPLAVHFHGYDASRYDVLEQYESAYREMFEYASAVIAVSQPMRCRLLELGSKDERTFVNHYGVDPHKFAQTQPSKNPPQFLAAGRFVAKKAPHLTLMAFGKAVQVCPDARLNMVGDGPLLATCRDMSEAMGLSSSVNFLGRQSHEKVAELMHQSRAFVQHSVEASDGDSEGSPVAITEAAFAGLPVIATRHAGIPELVDEGVTGYLVDEGDVPAMARHMVALLKDPDQAGGMGAAARRKMMVNHTWQSSVDSLWSILKKCF